MQVQDYICSQGIKLLQEVFYIQVKEYENLVVLNYNQIQSPKQRPIVMECRGLILEKGSWEVVSRGFDRFFNLGECPETQEHLDMAKAVVYEKVDGSLIKIYYYAGEWHISTRGTAFAEAETAWGSTFRSLVLKALGCSEEEFQNRANRVLNPHVTYVFEVTSVENRVVKVYPGYTLHFLGARVNKTGEYLNYEEQAMSMSGFGARLIGRYQFDSVEHCIETVKGLKDLDEGYVLYQQDKPVCKIKSPTYLAVHRIRGEGLTPKRIMQLVLMHEQDEYLIYFPEDAKYFTCYQESFRKLLTEMKTVWENTQDILEQKEFALAVCQYPYSACLFMARAQKGCPVHLFHQQREAFKIKVLEAYMEGVC